MENEGKIKSHTRKVFGRSLRVLTLEDVARLQEDREREAFDRFKAIKAQRRKSKSRKR